MNAILVSIDQVLLESSVGELPGTGLLGDLTAAALQRLLEDRGIPERLAGSDAGAIVLPDVTLAPGAGAAEVARALAASLYRALSGAGGPMDAQASPGSGNF